MRFFLINIYFTFERFSLAATSMVNDLSSSHDKPQLTCTSLCAGHSHFSLLLSAAPHFPSSYTLSQYVVQIACETELSIVPFSLIRHARLITRRIIKISYFIYLLTTV